MPKDRSLRMEFLEPTTLFILYKKHNLVVRHIFVQALL